MRKPNFLKKLAVFLTAGTMALSLTACGGMTVEKLLVEMDDAIAGKTMSQASMALEVVASMTTAGETSDMEIALEADVMTSTEPRAAFIDMEIDSTTAGAKTNETMQLYLQEEDGEMVNYIHTDSLDMWTKAEMSMSVEDFDSSFSNPEGEPAALPEDLTLAEETQIVENRETYVLDATLSGENLQATADEMPELDEALSQLGMSDIDFDFTSISAPISIYVDTETYMPLRMEMEIQGMNELVNGIIDSIMGSMMSGLTGLEDAGDLGIDMSELEAEMGEMDIEVDVTTAKIVINNISYDAVEVPAVPEDGKIMAEQLSFNPDQGDGTYVIQEGGYAVRISAPEGWTAYDMSYDYLTYAADDGMQEATYMMYTDMTSDDFAYYVEEFYVPSYTAEGAYVSHGAGSKIGEFETMYIECGDGINVYFAWAPVGDNGWVDIELFDYEGNDLETALTPMIEAIEEYQL